MPRYFFDYYDGATIEDDVGIEAADLDTACEIAIGVLKEISYKSHRDGYPGEQEVVVRAEDGSHLLKVLMTFSYVKLV